MPLVGIIMGSDSDLAVMKGAAEILDKIGIEYDLTIVSAHRTPERMYEYARSAKTRGLKVIIAGAGGAAHLPGMVAALTTLPVVGVPVKTQALSGIDSLYSIVQMPGGVPVATVAINGALNAGLIAAEIIGAFDELVSERLGRYKAELNDTVLKKAELLEKEKYEKYLALYAGGK